MRLLPLLRIVLFTLLSIVTFSACSLLGALTSVEFNNAIVEQLNVSSSTIQASANAYDKNIPLEVTELTVIDVSSLQKSLIEARTALETLSTIEDLESRDIEQQNAVRKDLKTYQLAAEAYLKRYQEIIGYYESKTYVQDVNQVEKLNSLLHTDYTTFIQSNNSLVQTLDKFVDQKKQNSQE